MRWLGLTMAVLLLKSAAGGDDLSNSVGRDLGYESYDSSSGYPDSRWQFTTAPAVPECGSMMRPLLAGVLIGAIVKVPLLILGKLLLLKAAAPLAVAGALIPLGVFSIYRAAMSQQGGGGSGTNSTSRMLPQGCLMAAACGIGSLAPKASVPTTSWLLKTIGEAADKEWGSNGQVYIYREAYMKGAASKSCPEYPCPFF